MADPLPPGAVTPPAPEGRVGGAGVRSARFVIGLIALCYAGVVGVSFILSVWTSRQEYREMALYATRSFFRGVVVTRRWGALHGGVYVPVTPQTPPNPYLEDPARDVVTTGGVRLTKVNPAYMTRMISELLGGEGGATFHITSLRPLRPGNDPDPWERGALEAFARGEKERWEISGGGEVFRYMAPLVTEASCLPCHSKQGYREGDVRGGISVALPFGPMAAGLRQHVRNLVAAHLLFLVVGVGFILFLGRSLVRRLNDLELSRRQVRVLEGMLPICSFCKKIRDEHADPHDQRSWRPLEEVIVTRTEAELSHGLCPECARRHYGEYYHPPREKAPAPPAPVPPVR